MNEQGLDFDLIETALAHSGKDEERNAYNQANYLARLKPVI